MGELDVKDQTLLVQACLAKMKGSRDGWNEVSTETLGFEALLRLVRLSYGKLHPDTDNRRPAGKVYSPNQRDEAEFVRGLIFKEFTQRPGAATFGNLRSLRQEGNFPVSESRLRGLALERVKADSELDPWLPDDILNFQDEFLNQPRTSEDLRRVGLVQLEEIAHDLLHGDFDQGKVVAALPTENDVQNWFAQALSFRQGQSYALARETHVAGERAPDITLFSLDSNARCPIEIKVPESWSLSDLRNGLRKQLCDGYLRVRENRYGILLPVHQNGRERGWKCEDRFLAFSEVEDYLRSLALEISECESLAPQPAVYGIDLSELCRK